MKYERLSNIIK